MPRTTSLRPAARARDRLDLFLIFSGVRGTSRENVGALVAMVRNEVEGRQRKGKAMEREVDTALLQTLTRFPRLGSCTVKVSCDERFQRTAFYRRGNPMGGALVLSIRHQLP